MAGGAGVLGGTVPTEGEPAAESIVISSRKESDKSSRASGAGNQGFGVGRKVAVEISVKGGRDYQGGSQKGSGG
jgi:predicted dinucleotide-binding enzyme